MRTRALTLATAITAACALAGCGSDDATDTAESTTAATSTTLNSTDKRLREKRVKSVCQKSVKQQLRDPDSAEFQNETVVMVDDEGTTWVVTGQVNADNAFGGKVGYTPYRCNATYNPDDDSTRGEATIAE